MSNTEIYNKIRTVPREATKKITGGRLNGFTDINPMWRIQTLTEQFGMVGIGWYYNVTNRDVVDGTDGEKVAVVDIQLYVKNGEEWSAPICGTGGSMLVAKEKQGLRTSDEAFKMALTDAISVACKALGMGADIYWQAGRSKYNTMSEATERPPQPLTKQQKQSLWAGIKKAAQAINVSAEDMQQLIEEYFERELGSFDTETYGKALNYIRGIIDDAKKKDQKAG